MIRLSDIHFRYNSRYILKSANFEVGRGDRIGIVGANGSGKTTLCGIIMGLLTPEWGEVEIFGRSRKRESDFEDVRGRVGYLFQDADDQLFCPTVFEDVAFGPLNLGKSPNEVRRIVSGTLANLRLDGFESRITYQLSGGEKRLVALATVLAMQPEILLLDEPTSGLDEETSQRIAKLLKSSDYAYVLISHDSDFVKQTVDKVLRIENGRILPAD